MTRHMKRGGKLWIRIFPDKPITKKPAETRMGKGKGNPEGWVAVVKLGRVLFEIEGIPDSRGAEAGSDGRFTVEGLPRVVGTLRGSADGYADAERDGVLPGASDAGTLALTRAARVVLRLRDALPFSVMPCATVTTGDGHSETYDVPSGDGSVEVTWAPPDVRFDLSVAARGFAPIDRTGLLVPAGSTLDLGEVAFPEPRVLAGVVRDATGAPAVGATIRVLGSSSSSSPEASCDEEGRFRLAPLGLGPATVVVLVGGQRWTSVTTQVRRPEESVEIRLPAPGTISATVRDARGEPVASLPLNLWLIGPDGAPEERHRTIVRTDSVGRVEVRLAPGRYRLEPHSAARRGWSKPVPDFDLASDATVTLDLAVDGH